MQIPKLFEEAQIGGIRQKLNENPIIALALAGLGIFIAILIIGAHLVRGRGSAPIPAPLAFFSDDDGRTFFADLASRATPFDRDGKEAYLAMVFRCGSGKPFVGYLRRYSSEQLARIQAWMEANHVTDTPLLDVVEAPPSEVKRPGEKVWYSAGDKNQKEYRRVTSTGCPDGESGTVSPVNPNTGAGR